MTTEDRPWPDDGVILFDGVCVLCSGWVRFVAERDAARRFRFTPIESPYGRRLAERVGIDPDDPDTNAVILGGRVLRRSDAALAVLSTLPGWEWAKLLRFVPRAARDFVYLLVARNRYRVFGRREVCYLGEGAVADRIIV
ncbi:MAG TPA: DCC1-like thiol-disulfide oxidoreductase family protein [Stellaceae bacterium]|jgi:predicted DCC family thiol-disulfide oxidoreductase YuxK|nr:DCC1-like thiol-disulfide oxidoreductase family protein [Stellaceae bacterium]